jgi:SAM-dependent methyltransferase
MQTNWDNFRVDRISGATFLKRNLIHLDLLRAAKARARGAVLEVGIGSGAQSAMLSRFTARVVSIDNDLRILRAALPNIRRFGRGLQTVAADAFAMPFTARAFGVAISQGLMEHFEDEQIGALLREQLRVCDAVVFSVPSDRYPRQDVGNERLMPPQRWTEIVASCLPADEFVVTARYYQRDLEALKYSLLARRWLGSFSVLVTIDRCAPPIGERV